MRIQRKLVRDLLISIIMFFAAYFMIFGLSTDYTSYDFFFGEMRYDPEFVLSKIGFVPFFLLSSFPLTSFFEVCSFICYLLVNPVFPSFFAICLSLCASLMISKGIPIGFHSHSASGNFSAIRMRNEFFVWS